MQVAHDADRALQATGHIAHQFSAIQVFFLGAVGKIHADHVDSAGDHARKNVAIAGSRPEGRDYFRAFLHHAFFRALASRARLEDFNCGKFLSFEKFEESAAARGNVANLVFDSVFRDGSNRVPAACDGKCSRAGNRIRIRRKR